MRKIASLLFVVLLFGCRIFSRSDPAPKVPPGLWVVHPDTGCTILTNFYGDTLRFIIFATLDHGSRSSERPKRWFVFPKDSVYYRGPISSGLDSTAGERSSALPSRDVLAVDHPIAIRDDPNRRIYRLNMRNPCRITTDPSILLRLSQPMR